MVVEVRLDLALQKAIPVSSYGLVIVDIQDGMGLSELLYEMEIDAKIVRLVTVNGSITTMSCVLNDGDKISLFS